MNIQSFRGLFGVAKPEPQRTVPTQPSVSENLARADGYTESSLPPMLMPVMPLSVSTPPARLQLDLPGKGSEEEQAREVHHKTMGSLGITSFEPRKAEKRKSETEESAEEIGYQLSDRRPSWRDEEKPSENSNSHLNTANTLFVEDPNDFWGGGGTFGGGGSTGTW